MTVPIEAMVHFLLSAAKEIFIHQFDLITMIEDVANLRIDDDDST